MQSSHRPFPYEQTKSPLLLTLETRIGEVVRPVQSTVAAQRTKVGREYNSLKAPNTLTKYGLLESV